MGALGVAQFMPATWEEVSKAMGLGLVDRRLAGPAILGGAYYVMVLRKRWSDAEDLGRHKLAVAGYNAGNGSISRAVRACGGALEWVDVSECLPRVTGKHAAETKGYVRLIFDKWWPAMEAVR